MLVAAAPGGLGIGLHERAVVVVGGGDAAEVIVQLKGQRHLGLFVLAGAAEGGQLAQQAVLGVIPLLAVVVAFGLL